MPNLVEFLWGRAIRKGVVQGLMALIGLVGVSKLAAWGITLDQQALAAAVIGALGTLRNYAKVKLGWTFL